MTVRVGIRLLGKFSLTVDGTAVDGAAWPARRSQQLVALLALAPHRTLTTDRVMDALWPDLDPDAARANLHKAATHARKALGERDAVVLRGGSATLWPAADVAVDAAVFEQAAVSVLASGDSVAAADVAATYGGELLPFELYEEWTITARERLSRLHRDVLRLGEKWADLVELDPADESAHVALMRVHQPEGWLHAAIRQFHRLRAALARELAASPGREATTLYGQLVGSSPSGWIRPALVGREVELVRARAALRRALEGRPAAILVTGAGGVGKTRLCEELLEHAESDGWIVLRACATENAATTPFAPLVDAIEALLAERPDLAAGLDGGDKAVLARLSASTNKATDGSTHRHGVLRLLGRVLSPPGAIGAALFIDDVHLADEATVAVAAIAASAPPPRGMLVVVTHRGDPPPPVAAMTAGLIANGCAVQLSLDGLTRHETDLIAAGIVGRVPNEDETALVWDLSAGNPFFALEVASTLATDSHTAAPAGPLGAVAARLERLPGEARAALRAAALVTDEFTVDGLSVFDSSAVAAVEAALAAGVVGATGSGSYRFRHDLVRQALATGASDDERRSAHARFAEHLVATEGAPGTVARHLVAAGDGAAARPFLATAAVDAIQVGAHADALPLLDEALRIDPRAPDLLALRADALFAGGDPSASAAYAVAMAVAPDPLRSSLAVRRARALVLAGSIPDALEALAAATDVGPAEHVQHLVTLGLAVWCAGDIDEAERLGLDARAQAAESGDLRDFVDATMLMAMVAHERGAWPQRASLDLLDTQLRPDLARVVIDAHLCVAESYLYGGVPYPNIIAFAADLRERGAQAGAPHAEAFATTLLGEAYLLMGDAARARATLHEAVALHRRVGILCGEALSLQRLAQALTADGLVADAEAALATALVAARGSPVATRHLLDRIHGTAIAIASGPVAALAAVDEAAHAVRGPMESCPPCSINLCVPAAIACADAADLDRARSYLSGAEQIVAAFYPQGGWHAALDEARAHLARAEGDEAAASALLSRAVEAFDRLGQRLDADRCRSGLAATAAI